MRRGLLALLCAATAACSAGRPEPDGAPPNPSAPLRVLDTGPSPWEPLRGFLPFFYDLYTFRGEGGRTRVVAAYAVPAGRLQRERRRGKTLYHFDVTLVLADTASGSLIRTDDSVSVRLPRSPERDHLLYTQVEVDAPPSAHTVHRVIMTDAATPGIGQLYEVPYPIPDYGGSGLMLSDIALGQPGVHGGWERGEVALALLPTSLLPEEAFDVYYEIYNLPAGSRYTTEIAVEELPKAGPEPGTGTGSQDAGAGRVTRLRFSGEAAAAADGTVAELRRVDTSLARGRYRLTVTITDEATGRAASGSRLFHVRGWAPGATLVPALPRGLLPRQP